MIDHVGIYGSRVAEGLSAFNVGLVADWRGLRPGVWLILTSNSYTLWCGVLTMGWIKPLLGKWLWATWSGCRERWGIMGRIISLTCEFAQILLMSVLNSYPNQKCVIFGSSLLFHCSVPWEIKLILNWYHRTSNIRHTKYQKLNDSYPIL